MVTISVPFIFTVIWDYGSSSSSLAGLGLGPCARPLVSVTVAALGLPALAGTTVPSAGLPCESVGTEVVLLALEPRSWFVDVAVSGGFASSTCFLSSPASEQECTLALSKAGSVVGLSAEAENTPVLEF